MEIEYLDVLIIPLALILGTSVAWVNLTLVLKDVAALLCVSGKSPGQVNTVLHVLVAASLHVLPWHHPPHYKPNSLWKQTVSGVWICVWAATTALLYVACSMAHMLIFFLMPTSFEKAVPAFCLSSDLTVHWNNFSLTTLDEDLCLPFKCSAERFLFLWFVWRVFS